MLRFFLFPPTSLLLLAFLNLGSTQAQAGLLLQDDFNYPDGQLESNPGWASTVGAQSLVLSAGKAVSGNVVGEYNGFHSFSRAGALNDPFSAAVDVYTPTHNSVFSIVLPTSFAQVGGWTYQSTGWRFGSIQTTVTTGARATMSFNPTTGTMSGSLLDLGNGSTLFQTSEIALNSPLQSELEVYLYTDSRAQIATTQFDNLSITTPTASVPEPTSLATFGLLAVATISMTRRRK